MNVSEMTLETFSLCLIKHHMWYHLKPYKWYHFILVQQNWEEKEELFHKSNYFPVCRQYTQTDFQVLETECGVEGEAELLSRGANGLARH